METFLFLMIFGVILISVFFNIILYIALKNMRKREKNRLKRIDHNGSPVYATVTRVIHQKRQLNYVVQAQWLSRETRKTYYFQDTLPFKRGALNFHPKIQKGDIVQVNVIFGEYAHSIKRIK